MTTTPSFLVTHLPLGRLHPLHSVEVDVAGRDAEFLPPWVEVVAVVPGVSVEPEHDAHMKE